MGSLAFAKAHLAEGGWFSAVEPHADNQLKDKLQPSA
jgi:hypothetical protein